MASRIAVTRVLATPVTGDSVVEVPLGELVDQAVPGAYVGLDPDRSWWCGGLVLEPVDDFLDDPADAVGGRGPELVEGEAGLGLVRWGRVVSGEHPATIAIDLGVGGHDDDRGLAGVESARGEDPDPIDPSHFDRLLDHTQQGEERRVREVVAR